MTEPFQHAVASGDPRDDSVVLWTRVTTGETSVPVTWVIALDAELKHVVGEGEARAEAEHDHCVHVVATGLEPSTTYHYAFEAGGRRSPVARTRTLPRGEVQQVRFAAYSCAKYSAGYFNGYARMADRDDLDFVLCLGDYIYEYSNQDKGLGAKIGRAFEPDNECVTLSDYRTRYAQYHRDPDVQALHLAHPLIAIPDDHEVCDDTWREGAEKHDETKDGPWHERKAAALRAWQEWLPVRLERPGRIYREFHLGNLVDLILLDTRSYRDKQVGPPEMYDEDRTLLGAEQFDWLTTRLRGSRSSWRIVGQGVLITRVSSEFRPDEFNDELSELGVITADDYGPEPDQWDGYPAERRRLLNDINDNTTGDVLFISGDCHSSWVADQQVDPEDRDSPSIAAEFAVTSMTSENLDDEMGWEPRTGSIEIEQALIDDNEHVKWCEFDSHGYTIIDVTEERIRGDWWFVDEVHRRVDGEHHGGAWQVRRGSRTAEEAEGAAP